MKLRVRRKRVIDLTHGRHQEAIYSEVGYAVNINRNNEIACMGALLSITYVINPNSCVDKNRLSEYRILTGAGNLRDSLQHNVTEKFNRIRGYEHMNDLALLKMHPPLNLQASQSRPIGLLIGPVSVNRIGLISGWGLNIRPS